MTVTTDSNGLSRNGKWDTPPMLPMLPPPSATHP
ncbi:hypothetical protein GQ607_006151 [Colletotrichum asianum]|uniref:Uncharacterized protein n=1 Tax=Colletotrichum asianum TaxID=702518 RepID=A0A8H3WEK5_9PEZI|nr:hypothetical protein GQ607_006151 [Colletotrichum asianum]